jgi:hypothetical protein
VNITNPWSRTNAMNVVNSIYAQQVSGREKETIISTLSDSMERLKRINKML